MDITQSVLNDLAKKIGQLEVQLTITVLERDAARAEAANLKEAISKMPQAQEQPDEGGVVDADD